MSWNSGPSTSADENGRVTEYGYVISGNDGDGYRARIEVGLTAKEAMFGVRELLYAESLADLLTLAKAQLILRSMVGEAASAAKADAQRARGAETQ
jgi:hypothetical protein